MFYILKIKQFFSKIVNKHSPSLYYHLSYFHNRRKLLSLKNPKDLSEIWIKWMLDGGAIVNYTLADKYLVRNYVAEKGLKSTLINLIASYDLPTQIDFNSLPEKFVIKLNFGAGMNIICQNKKLLDKEFVIRKLSDWIKKAHSYSLAEEHYNLITPKIICEEFIDDGSGHFPTDYKFLCLNGKVKCILVMSNRESGKPTHARYTPDWKPLPEYSKGDTMSEVDKPRNLAEMIKTAETLAGDLDLVRVDLYSNGSKIWFGEMTLTPAGCIFHSWSQKALDDLGEIYRAENNN